MLMVFQKKNSGDISRWHINILKNTVYDVRQTNRDPRSSRRFWWNLLRRANRNFVEGFRIYRDYHREPETAKHRLTFSFLRSLEINLTTQAGRLLLTQMLTLRFLSSAIHLIFGRWQQAVVLLDRPVYNKSRCFEPFPFPALEEGELKAKIRELGERLDAHRKARQAAHPGLTLTGMYNVLEKLRAGEALSEKDKKIHDEGLVTVLKQIHDDLDEAVYEAYGWSDLHEAQQALNKGTLMNPETGITMQIDVGSDADLAKALREHEEVLEQILLTRLVSLNHERAAEEAQGKVRWLRPEYQAPDEVKANDVDLPMEIEKKAVAIATAPAKLKWPKDIAAQFAEVSKLLPTLGADAEAIAGCFGRKSAARTKLVEGILETLKSLGKLE